MARPKKDEAEKLTERVAFRLTKTDHDDYLSKVTGSGLSPSEFFRDAVLSNKTEIIAKPKADEDKKRLIFLINKASNNVNQLAHRANADHAAGLTSQETYVDILQELQAFNRYLKATLNAG